MGSCIESITVPKENCFSIFSRNYVIHIAPFSNIKDIILSVLLKLSLQLSLHSPQLVITPWEQICLLVQDHGVGYLHAYQTQKGQYG